MRKTIIILAALLAASVCADAKSKILERFIDKVSSSLVSFDYSFSLQSSKSKAKMTGEGNVKIQGNSFMLEGRARGLVRWFHPLDG